MHYLEKIGWKLEGQGERFEIISDFRKKTGIFYINNHNPRIEINEKDIYLVIPAKGCEVEMTQFNSVTIHLDSKVFLKLYNFTKIYKKNYEEKISERVKRDKRVEGNGKDEV